MNHEFQEDRNIIFSPVCSQLITIDTKCEGKKEKGKEKKEEGKKWEREKAEERAEGTREKEEGAKRIFSFIVLLLVQKLTYP